MGIELIIHCLYRGTITYYKMKRESAVRYGKANYSKGRAYITLVAVHAISLRNGIVGI